MNNTLLTTALGILLTINAFSVNLINNGTFEHATDNYAWTNVTTSPGVQTAGVETVSPISGTKSAKVTITTAATTITDYANANKLSMYTLMSNAKAATYKIKFKALATNAIDISTVQMTVKVTNLTTTGTAITNQTVTMTETTQSYELTFTNATVCGYNYLQFQYGNFPAGTTILIDDVSVQEVTNPLTDGNLCNGDFEAGVVGKSASSISGMSGYMDATGWTQLKPVGGTCAGYVSSTAPISGAKSYVFNVGATPGSTNASHAFGWAFSAVVGKKYTCSFKAKTSVGSFNAGIKLISYNGGLVNFDNITGVALTTTAQSFTFTSNAISDYSFYYVFCIQVGTLPVGTNVIIDDVVICQSYLEIPTISAASAITGGGFTTNWTTVPRASSYDVLVYQGATLVSTTNASGQSTTSKVLSGLVSNTEYTYKVIAKGDDISAFDSEASKASAVVTTAGFYVSTTGNDANSGTEFSPWKTISKAANTLTAGQAAYIRGGTYNENVTIKNSGSAGRYISLVAYPNETPIVDGTGNSAWTLMNLNSKSYIRIAGIRFQNGTVGISNGKNNILIENNEVANFTNQGIMLNSCSVATVRGNIVDNVCSSSYGECITFAQSEYIDIVNNEVRNGSTNTLGGEGIDVKSSKHMRVYGNVVHDLHKLGIYIDSYDGLDYDIEVFNNRVYNCNDGIIISGEQRNAVEQVSVYNNVVYDCTYIGIGVVNWATHYTPGTGYPVQNIKIENNTVSSTGGISIDAIQGNDFTIRNNIIYNYNPAIGYGVVPTGLTVEKNMANMGSVSVLGTGGILSDPKFINPITKDFHLKSTSPAIDAGITNNVVFDNELMSRPAGSTLDIGAYEYGAGITDTIPMVTKPSFSTATSAITQSSNVGYENTSTGVVTLNPTSINVAFTSTTNKNIAAIRFTNINIPQGATIINARIKVKMNQARVFDNYPIRINAESSANSPVLTTISNSISNKTKTTNYSNWLPGSSAVGDWKITPSLDFLLQEIVSRPDWVSGNAMTYTFEYTDISISGLSFVFNSFDGNESNSPQLSIEYFTSQMGAPAVVTSIAEPEKRNQVRIYPNPAKDYVMIDMQDNGFSEMEVFDILGKQILNQSINSDSRTLVLDVKSWTNGIHIIRLKNKNKISNFKIIVE